jgi:hypothetical protein
MLPIARLLTFNGPPKRGAPSAYKLLCDPTSFIVPGVEVWSIVTPPTPTSVLAKIAVPASLVMNI